MATVLVIGASRGIGLETVKCALDAGHRVRAFARGAASIPIDVPALEKIAGDALDTRRRRGGRGGRRCRDPVAGRAQGTAGHARAARRSSRRPRVSSSTPCGESGVRRLLAVTGLGAGDSRGHGGFLYDALVFPLVLKRVYDDKDVQEQMIRASGLEWTIARPGLLTSGPATGQVRALVDRKDWRAGSISRADVADFLVREAFERRFVGKTPLLIR